MKTTAKKLKTFAGHCLRAYRRTFGKTEVSVSFSQANNRLMHKNIMVMGGVAASASA